MNIINMKTSIIIELIIFLSISDALWAQEIINVNNWSSSGNQTIDSSLTPNISIYLADNQTLINTTSNNNSLDSTNSTNLIQAHNESTVLDTFHNNASKIDDRYITQTIDILRAANMSQINQTKNQTLEQNPNLITNNSSSALNISETDGNSTQQTPNVTEADSDANNTNSTTVDQPIGQTINQTTESNISAGDKPLEVIIPESDNLDFGPFIALSNITHKNETIAESNNQTIAESQNQTIAESQNQTIAESQNQTIAESQNQTITESQNPTITESQNQTIAESQNQTITESQNQTIAESQNQTITESQNQTIAESQNQTIAESQNQTIAESQNQTITSVGNDEKVTTIHPFIPTIFIPESHKTSNDATNNQISEAFTQSPERLQSTTIENNTVLPELNSSLSSTNNETFLNSSTTTLNTNETETTTHSVTLNGSIPEITTQLNVILNETSDHSELMANITTTEPIISTKTTLKPNITIDPIKRNISSITLTLPNINYVDRMPSSLIVNIVTITFIAKAVDIFQWVSTFDVEFRNFTCNSIDSERKWCSINRVIYVSPSPLVTNNQLIINFLVNDSTENDLDNYHAFPGPVIVESLKNETTSLEKIMHMKVMSLQTNFGTIVVKPLEQNNQRLAKFELLVFIFTVVMFICTVLLCIAIICSCTRRKINDINHIELSSAGRHQTGTTNGGIDLNSASNILREENNKRLTNVINIDDGWVAPIDHVIENDKFSKYDNLNDTKL